jgi:hypothetical protein
MKKNAINFIIYNYNKIKIVFKINMKVNYYKIKNKGFLIFYRIRK